MTPDDTTQQPLWTRLQPWAVCFAAALFFFFEFIQLNVFNAIGPSLTQEFDIDGTVLATISDKYFLANVIFLFPAGIILDRVSTRKAILLGFSVSILCTFGFSQAHSIWQMQLYRFITGIAASFCLLSCVRLASRWFPPRRMALVVGLIVTFAMAGGMVAQTPFTMLIKLFGWRTSIILNAVSGVLMLIVIFFVIKDRPEHNISSTLIHTTPRGKAFWFALRSTLARPQNWIGGLYTSLMNLPIFLLGAIWGIFYLTQVQHLSSAHASIVTSMLFIGLIIGSPLIGWFSDCIRRRKSPMIAGAILAILVIVILMYAKNLTLIELSSLFFALGFITSAQIISYPLIAESNPPALTATAEGMASVLIMAGGYTQTLFAYLIQWHWDHQHLNGVPYYSVHNYRVGFAIMPIAFMISLILSFFVKETYCESQHQHNEN